MGIPNKVFNVSGNKIASLVFAEDGLRFSSSRFDSLEAFNEAWPKALTLATKIDIKYSSIKSVAKENPGKKVVIKYKGMAGLPSECVFSFDDITDYEILSAFLEKDQYFRKAEEKLSPIKSAGPYILGLLFTVGITIFCHFQAVDITSEGGLEKADADTGSAKTKMFNHFIALIGDKGVWAIGTVIMVYIAYKIYKRYTNPPDKIKFTPPNAG